MHIEGYSEGLPSERVEWLRRAFAADWTYMDVQERWQQEFGEEITHSELEL